MNKDTVCKNCCFATWDGITQIGCERGLIEKYKEKGASVIEAYDEDKEFYVIQDRTCPFNRSEKWKERCGEDRIEEMLEVETRLPFHSIVFVNESKDDLQKTIDSLSSQTLKPAMISVVNPKGSKIRPATIKGILDDSKLLWRLQNQLRKQGEISTIHNLYKTFKAPYYAVFYAGHIVEKDFFSSISSFVIDKLEQFGAILPNKNGSGRVIPASVHEYWYFQGDPKKTILENLKEWECQNNKKICYKINEIK